MADEPKSDDTKTKTDDPSPAVATLQTEVAKLQRDLAEAKSSSSTTADLLTDPAIRKVLEMRDAGQDVVVQTKDPIPKTVDTSKVDFDDLTSKEVFELGREDTKLLVQSAQDSRVDALTDKVSTLTTAVEQLVTDRTTTGQTALKAEVTAAKKKYSDFNTYAEEMNAIFKADTSGVYSIDEIYLIAKNRKTGTLGAPEPDDSARPGSTTARPTGLEGTENHQATKAGFKKILQDRRGAFS